jgi:hypothetical protein
LLSYLPGSASEDLSITAGAESSAKSPESYDAQIAAARAQVLDALQNLPPNPLRVLALEERATALSKGDMVLSEVGSDE